MCNKRSNGNASSGTIDPCIREEIYDMNKARVETLGSCCGHGKYTKTVVIKSVNGKIKELYSDRIIPRQKRFYIKDKEGFYYIPEVENVS